MNRSIYRPECGLGCAKEALSYGARWCHLTKTTELSVCGGDAAFLSNNFDDLLLGRIAVRM